MTFFLLVLRIIVILLLVYVVYNIFVPDNKRKKTASKYGSGDDNIVDADFDELED